MQRTSLITADARLVEDAFRDKIASLGDENGDSGNRARLLRRPEQSGAARAAQSSAASLAKVVDKSVLSLPQRRRLRDKHHIKWVSKRPCLICGRQPSDPHHLRFAQPRALGRKVSDEFIVPLCRAHHREVHRSSDEVGWWKQAGLDPLGFAQKLWRDSHPLQPRSPVLCSANKRRWRTGAFVPQTRKPWARDMIPRFLVVFPVHFHALLGHA